MKKLNRDLNIMSNVFFSSFQSKSKKIKKKIERH
jgi:hypothetical protein